MSPILRHLAAVALASLMALAAGCSLLSGPQGERVELNLDRKAVAKAAIHVGDTLVLDVRNPGSGGYEFAGAYFDPDILRLDSHKLIPPEQAMPGNFGRATYELVGLKPGKTLVVIKIKRPWEKKPPEQYKSVQVTVEP
jgi:hypothetical protein